MDLHEDALCGACRSLVKETLWQSPDPRSIRDIVDEGQIAHTFSGYLSLARLEAECLADHGLDPNIVTRAIEFLAQGYGISSMKDDLSWFGWTLHALVNLVIAIQGTPPKPPSFLKDLEDMIQARHGVGHLRSRDFEELNTDQTDSFCST